MGVAEFPVIAAFAAFVFFAYRRLLRYLHMFQQDEYDGTRFLTWLFSAQTFDKRVSAALLLFAVLAYISRDTDVSAVAAAIVALLFAVAAFFEPDPRRSAKKKLVLTNRAQRILAVAACLAVAAGLAAAFVANSLAWMVAVQLLPLLLVLGNWLLTPVEAHIQKGFRTAAEKRLRSVAPQTIAITGSFGKTSVKHILGHVLQMNTNALFTPGSVNTVMGISRIINERLADNCRYFLVEMGAYGIGSIARLCKFTPPDHGIITAIGEAHYERFKDLETVARAKFELAEAVAERDGLVVIDESVLARAYAKDFVEQGRARFVTVGESEAADFRLLANQQRADGLHVQLSHGGEQFALFAPLFGLHHGRNIALAFAIAVKLGFAPDRIVAALRSTPQIAHRLEVKSHPSGATYVDDAFNANPDGIANGLDLLQVLRRGDGRRIIVTPGVAELGARHDEVHRQLGAKAAESTDVTIAIRPDRIAAFVDGFKAAETESELLTFDRFNDARQWFDTHLGPDDVILIANDLPDLLEREFAT